MLNAAQSQQLTADWQMCNEICVCFDIVLNERHFHGIPFDSIWW